MNYFSDKNRFGVDAGGNGPSFEISPRFRRSLVERIERLERDADLDEEISRGIEDEEHRERHLSLVAAQRAEALRMRIFLEKARTRLPRPLIEL